MKHRHEMPFGAECRDDGSVRFRLWAPAASSVSLALDGASAKRWKMSDVGGGYFEWIAPQAGAGTRYRFQIDSDKLVPDPASRYQPAGVHQASEVIDPAAFEWHDEMWQGRPWSDAVIYELHLGTFTPEGTLVAAEKKLDYLAGLGVTAIELMPISSFPGLRNWGYDGVLPYAPAAAYGRPENLKQFIDAAHGRNLMVLLDVVYNHFGPEGNYLPLYAPQFLSARHTTAWGPAINFDGPGSRMVRDFFIHNALYWLEEYHFDGLRLDAVQAVVDDSQPHFLIELAEKIRAGCSPDRHIHLVLENDDNAAHLLTPTAAGGGLYTAQWNDDIHHALHVLITGEKDGYYSDYAGNASWQLGRCLAEGFSFQGERSRYRNGKERGEPSRELAPASFVSFLQNHDQAGNRALGERIGQLAEPAALRAGLACLLLAPSPPLLFMGEEFGATTPFLFFCDFSPDLADRVREGRRAEFAGFTQFKSAEARSRIPDPNDRNTFLACQLDWSSLENPISKTWLRFYRELLSCRREAIVPRVAKVATGKAEYDVLAEKAIFVRWPFVGGGGLTMVANFSETEIGIPNVPPGRLLYSTAEGALQANKLAAFAVVWLLNE